MRVDGEREREGGERGEGGGRRVGRERVECEIEWSVGERGVRREGKDMGREWDVRGEGESRV